ncbi:hypothetical protein AVEN_269716-1 [Araneus ventricosus]|uniref:Uncharacterized protein n=1 Tax=Araneus ventricosus TaxID=182803 RepID=A0A4Y2KSF1_ARAVE|nr:hypothetical protein AVEN_269716-1 [Araneus ventricosus]
MIESCLTSSLEGNKKIVDEKEENVIVMEESEDEISGSFQQEIDAAEMEEVIYLKSSMLDFSTNLFVLIYNLGDDRMKTHYTNFCGIQEVDGGEYNITGVRSTNLAK